MTNIAQALNFCARRITESKTDEQAEIWGYRIRILEANLGSCVVVLTSNDPTMLCLRTLSNKVKIHVFVQPTFDGLQIDAADLDSSRVEGIRSKLEQEAPENWDSELP